MSGRGTLLGLVGLAIADYVCLTWINANGAETTPEASEGNNTRCFGMIMDGRAHATGIRRAASDATLVLILNACHDMVKFTLPEVAGGETWSRIFDPSAPDLGGETFATGKVYSVTGRSVLLFKRGRYPEPELLIKIPARRASSPCPDRLNPGRRLLQFGASGLKLTPDFVATYPHCRMPEEAARTTLTKDGRIRVKVAAHEMRIGTATAQTQVAAERLGLEMDQVSFGYGDSVMPGVVLADGSQQTASIGAAVIAAQHALMAKLLKLAGNSLPLAGLSAEEVGGLDGGLAKLDEPG